MNLLTFPKHLTTWRRVHKIFKKESTYQCTCGCQRFLLVDNRKGAFVECWDCGTIMDNIEAIET